MGGMFQGAVGGGVARWAGLVSQVLAMLGQSQGWVSTVLRRMNQESGGNPNSINLWDSNAAMGDPSRGLMQTIGSTFAAYAGPFRGLGIYNPMANIYAGLNYALHTYGSLAALNRPGGYANGTSYASAGWRMVGERGPEMVRFRGGESVVPNSRLGGSIVIEKINVQVSPTARPGDVGREIVDAIRAFERGAGKGWRS
jgi:SLT domain-containing protein